jgi:hypothetical protein
MLGHDELLRTVHGDLQYLRERWDESVDETSLRISSPVLRRLLVDLELQRAWKASGFAKEPIISTSTLDPILGMGPVTRLTAAWAGGAKTPGVEIYDGAFMRGYVMTGEEAAQFGRERPAVALGLRTYVEAPCMVLEGQVVPRRVLLKYIANKLGGAHFDPGRAQKPEDRLYRLLDQARDSVRVANHRVVYFELLSAGQALVKSADVRQLYERLGTRA